MGFWDWLFGRRNQQPEVWRFRRFIRNHLQCVKCGLGFYDGEIVLVSNLGRVKHRRCRK